MPPWLKDCCNVVCIGSPSDGKMRRRFLRMNRIPRKSGNLHLNRSQNTRVVCALQDRLGRMRERAGCRLISGASQQRGHDCSTLWTKSHTLFNWDFAPRPDRPTARDPNQPKASNTRDKSRSLPTVSRQIYSAREFAAGLTCRSHGAREQMFYRGLDGRSRDSSVFCRPARNGVGDQPSSRRALSLQA